MNVKIITDVAALGKLVDAIKRAGAKLDADIHTAGCSALAHLKASGDIGMCNRLYLAMPKGARKAAMTSWLLAHGALVANTGADKAEKPFAYTKDKVTNVEAGMADPWFDHKPDPAPDTVFDVQVELTKLLKRAQGKTLAHGELITAVQGILAATSAAAHDKAQEQLTDESGTSPAPVTPAGETAPSAN